MDEKRWISAQHSFPFRFCNQRSNLQSCYRGFLPWVMAVRSSGTHAYSVKHMAFLEFNTIFCRNNVFPHIPWLFTFTYYDHFTNITTSTLVIFLHEMKPHFGLFLIFCHDSFLLKVAVSLTSKEHAGTGVTVDRSTWYPMDRNNLEPVLNWNRFSISNHTLPNRNYERPVTESHRSDTKSVIIIMKSAHEPCSAINTLQVSGSVMLHTVLTRSDPNALKLWPLPW